MKKESSELMGLYRLYLFVCVITQKKLAAHSSIAWDRAREIILDHLFAFRCRKTRSGNFRGPIWSLRRPLERDSLVEWFPLRRSVSTALTATPPSPSKCWKVYIYIMAICSFVPSLTFRVHKAQDSRRGFASWTQWFGFLFSDLCGTGPLDMYGVRGSSLHDNWCESERPTKLHWLHFFSQNSLPLLNSGICSLSSTFWRMSTTSML